MFYGAVGKAVLSAGYHGGCKGDSLSPVAEHKGLDELGWGLA